MPKLVTLISTTVIRDGKRVTPEIGKSFDFTKEEADYILKASPLGLRKPVNESKNVEDDGPAGGDADAGAAQPKPKANTAPKKPKAAEKGAPAKTPAEGTDGSEADEASDNDADGQGSDGASASEDDDI